MHADGDVNLGIAGLGPAAQIGEGGNAVVYRCRQESLDRDVAVKLLKRVKDEGTQRRFTREQRAMGRMSQHDGIVTVYESGITAAGQPYIVMPLLPRSLHDELEANGPFPWPAAVALIADVADAVHFAHGQGLVHRDLKPANLMRSFSGRPLVADFGISRIVDSGVSLQSTALTLTPAYSPPEALSGVDAEASADVYSLGATLYALIEGHPPFADPAESPDLLTLIRRIAEDPVPPLTPDVPRWVDAVIADAMTKDPADRIPTARDLAERLRSGERASTVPVGATTGDGSTRVVEGATPPTPPASSERNPWVLRGVAGAVALVAVGVISFVVGSSGGDDAALDAATPEPTVSTGPETDLGLEEPDAAPGTSAIQIEAPADDAATVPAGDAVREVAPVAMLLPPSATGMAHVVIEAPVIGNAEYASVAEPARYRPQQLLGNSVDFFADVTSTTNAFYREWLVYSSGKEPDRLASRIPQSWTQAEASAVPSFPPGSGNEPVTGVSLDNALEYCTYVNKRLLSEVQWELAATGGFFEPDSSDVLNWVDGSEEYGPVEAGQVVARGTFGSERLDDYYRTIGIDGDVFRSVVGIRCASDTVRPAQVVEIPEGDGTIYQDDFSDLDSGWPSVTPDGRFSLGYHPVDVFHIETELPRTQVAAATPVAAPADSTVSTSIELRTPDFLGQFRYGLLARSSAQGYVVFTILPTIEDDNRYVDWCLGQSSEPILPAGERIVARSSESVSQCDGALAQGRLPVAAFNNALSVSFEGSTPVATIDGVVVELPAGTTVDVPPGSPGFYIESFDEVNVSHVHYDGVVVSAG